MKRVAVHALEGVGALVHENAQIPEPGPGQVRLKVAAVGLGYVDGLLIAGRYQWRPPLPYVPGGEIAGVIDGVGGGVEKWTVGQRVASWQMGGGLSEYCLVPADSLALIPEGLSFTSAAAALLDYSTVDYALNTRAHLQEDELVLVLGANGGIGNAAIQVARKAGAVVVAGVSCEARRAAAESKGVSMTVDLSSPAWRDELRSVTRGEAPDIVIDPLGGSFSEPAFRSLAKRGRYLVIGFAAQGIPSIPVNLALLKNADLIGIDIRDVAENSRAAFLESVENIFHELQQGTISPPQINEFQFAEACAAFRSLKSQKRNGKTLIVFEQLPPVTTG